MTKAAKKLTFSEMEDKASEIVGFLKIMTHEQRLLILCTLSHEGAKSAGEIVEFTSLSQSACSQHLAIMREAEMVATTRHGNSIVYSIKDKRIEALLQAFSQIFCSTTGVLT